jgi:RNA polymerase sigma-70 factor (ECF subfamily)
VAAVQAGAASAFDELVRRHRVRIFSVLQNLMGNREDAADLTQEVFIQAFRNIRNFRGQSRFYTWLYRIAVNRAMKQLRKERVRKFFNFFAGNDGEEMEEPVDEHSSPQSVPVDELRQRLDAALADLSAKHRTTVILAEMEELSAEEIGTVMNCSPGTVRSRLHYAKARLKVALGRYLGK